VVVDSSSSSLLGSAGVIQPLPSYYPSLSSVPEICGNLSLSSWPGSGGVLQPFFLFTSGGVLQALFLTWEW
jgi:hypothetical protein